MMKPKRERFDTAWRKSRIAARLLLRRDKRPFTPRERTLANFLSKDPEVTDRLIQQGLYYLGIGAEKPAFDQRLLARQQASLKAAGL
jgi:hypothetical protein